MIRKALISLALLLLVAATHAAIAGAEETVTVKILPQASVRAPAITLGEIGKIKGGSEILASELSKLRLAISPMPGSWRELDKEIIQAQMLRGGYGPQTVSLECPQVVLVYRESQMVGQAALESRLRDFIIANAPWQPEEMEITSVTRVGDQVLPAGELAIEIHSRGSSNYLGPTPFSVELLVDGQSVQQLVMQAQISVYRDAVVAANPIPLRQIIDISDVELRKVDISTVRDRTFDSIDHVVGMASSVFIQTGQVITARQINKPILVHRNEQIHLVASRPGFIIRTTAIAQEDGRMGDIIRVLNPTSRKILEAEVTGSQRARLVF